MEDGSASKNPKGTNTKKDKEDMMPKTTLFSKIKRITDTNVGIVNMLQVKDRLKEGQSPLAKKIYRSGIVHAAAFPPTLPCPELVMECASKFDLISKSIIFDEGKRISMRQDWDQDSNELRKVAIKKKHLNTLSSLNAFIGFAKEYEKDHEKTLQAASSMVKSVELKMKYTPCPPMEEVNKRLARFIALAKRMKEKGRFILEDHLM